MEEIVQFLPFTLFSALVAVYRYYAVKNNQDKKEMVKYNGSCHCGAVQFEVEAPKHLKVINCNCSVCEMKKNWHFIVPQSQFRILFGEDYLAEYRFNTRVACHKFCKICGVQAFYNPRSNPNCVAVTFACIPKKDKYTYEIIQFDGNNWEDQVAKFAKDGVKLK